MGLPARPGQAQQLEPQRREVVRHADRLAVGVEAAGEPRVLGGDTGRAAAGVAPLGLDAPGGHHRLATDRHRVAAQGEGEQRRLGQAQLPRPDEDDLLVQAALGEGAVHAAERPLERQGDVVGEHERAGAGAALSPIDGHEVDAATGAVHAQGEVVPEHVLAHRRLDAHRPTGGVGDGLDQLEHGVDVVEGRVGRRALAVDPDGDAPGLGDLGGDLGAGQQAPDARLGPLGELDLDGADRVLLAQVDQPGEVEATPIVAAPEVGGADLEDEVGTVEVVDRDTALSGVVPRVGGGRPAVQGLDGGAAQRPEAHPRDVDHRVLPGGEAPATRSAEHLGDRQRRRRVGVGRLARQRRQREGHVLDDQVVLDVLDVVVGPEAEVGVLPLGRRVDPAALVAAEGPLLVVVGDDVLAQLGADALEQEAEVPEDREVAGDGVALLQQVVQGHAAEGGHRRPRQLLGDGHGPTLGPPVAGPRRPGTGGHGRRRAAS